MISCVRFSTLCWGRWPYAPRLLLVVAITLSRRKELWTSWVQNRLHQSVRNQICRKNFLICCQKIVAVSCLGGSVKGMLHCTTFQLSVSHSFHKCYTIARSFNTNSCCTKFLNSFNRGEVRLAFFSLTLSITSLCLLECFLERDFP